MWTTSSGVIGVRNNALYAPNGLGGDLAWMDAGKQPSRVLGTINSPDYAKYPPLLVVRYIDALNYLYVRAQASNHKLALYSMDAGVETRITGTFDPTLVDGVPSVVEVDYSIPKSLIVYADNIFGIGVTLSQTLSNKFLSQTKIAVGFMNLTSGPVVANNGASVTDIQVYG